MPWLSVVIPAFNAEAAIARDLAAVRSSLDAAGVDWELVVVDDGSTDGTGKAAEAAGGSAAKAAGSGASLASEGARG